MAGELRPLLTAGARAQLAELEPGHHPLCSSGSGAYVASDMRVYLFCHDQGRRANTTPSEPMGVSAWRDVYNSFDL